MVKIVNEIKNNYILIASVMSWACAQGIKTIIDFVFTKNFKAERLVGAGGMPSSHSAFVTALTVATAQKCGLSSVEFAIAFALAAVVIYDAMGVRRAAGEQAKMINMITNELFNGFNEEDKIVKNLKELLGHTPLEVLAGVILGIVVTCCLNI